MLVGRFFLIQKINILPVEFVEKIAPGNAFERFVAGVIRKVNPQNADTLGSFGAFDRRRESASLFDPFLNRVMVSGTLRFHVIISVFWAPPMGFRTAAATIAIGHLSAF